jgi:LasA protease
MTNLKNFSPVNTRSLILTWVLLIILCVIIFIFAPPFGEGRLSYADEGMIMEPLLSDGQFVWGPNVGDFNIKIFLETRQSPLTTFANDIEAIAAFTSVNPKVLLAVLEIRYSLVNSLSEGLEPNDILQYIEETAYDLAIPFYNHLYTWGSRKHMRETSQPKTAILSFEDEITEQLDPGISSGTFAVASALSQNQSYEIWQSTVSTKSSEGFAQVFAEFFPDTDPLSTANNINPPALPPDNFFQLPFPLGGEWTFNGPHSWCGGDACWQQPPDRSSIDFATNWHHGEPYPDHYTVAAAEGIGNVRTPYTGRLPCWYEIDHGEGWKTSYYHLQKLDDPGTRGSVMRNQSLGVIAEEVCNGGFANGAHVHFTLWYNGSYYDLDGIKLSGWEVHSGPTPYTTGFLERGGQILNVYETITNDYNTYYGSSTDFALQFKGNDQADQDRITILMDDPNTDVPGPPADVGMHDFVIEWWMKANPGENAAPEVTCGPNDDWKEGNILFDRSTSFEGSEWGVSMAGGYIVFGIRGDDSQEITLCSSSTVDDGEWHHIAVQRNRWDGSTYMDGQLWLFVDGILEASALGPRGDISYPDDAAPGEVCGPSGTDPCTGIDPVLVIGACKWEGCLGYHGVIDDIRFSWWLRYFEDFEPPTSPIKQDSKTVGILRLNEGRGDILYDTGGYEGGTSNGIRMYGGDPAGPEWIYSDLFFGFFQYIPHMQ